MRMNRMAALSLGAGMIAMAACSDAPTAAPSAVTLPKTTSFVLGTAEFALRAPIATELIVCKAGDVGGSFNLTVEAGESGAGNPDTRALPFTLNPGAAGVANCTLAATDNGDADAQLGDYFTVTESVDAGVTSSRVCYLNNGDLVEDGCPDRFFINTAHGWTVVVTNVAPPPPPPPSGCTYTQGYWKTHGPSAKGNNSNEWDLTTITLGTVDYTQAEAQSIFNAPVKGNGLISLAHQLMAAKLNLANGAVDPDIQDVIDDADALIGGLVVPPVGSGFLSPAAVSSLVNALTAFNEGATGPGHCGDEIL